MDKENHTQSAQPMSDQADNQNIQVQSEPAGAVDESTEHLKAQVKTMQELALKLLAMTQTIQPLTGIVDPNVGIQNILKDTSVIKQDKQIEKLARQTTSQFGNSITVTYEDESSHETVRLPTITKVVSMQDPSIKPNSSESSSVQESPQFIGTQSPGSFDGSRPAGKVMFNIVDNNRNYQRNIDLDNAFSPSMSPVDTPTRNADTKQLAKSKMVESLGSFGKLLHSSSGQSGEESNRLMFGMSSEPVALTSVAELLRVLKVSSDQTFRLGKTIYRVDFPPSPITQTVSTQTFSVEPITKMEKNSSFSSYSSYSNKIADVPVMTVVKKTENDSKLGMFKTFSEKVQTETLKMMEKQKSSPNPIDKRKMLAEKNKTGTDVSFCSSGVNSNSHYEELPFPGSKESEQPNFGTMSQNKQTKPAEEIKEGFGAIAARLKKPKIGYQAVSQFDKGLKMMEQLDGPKDTELLVNDESDNSPKLFLKSENLSNQQYNSHSDDTGQEEQKQSSANQEDDFYKNLAMQVAAEISQKETSINFPKIRKKTSKPMISQQTIKSNIKNKSYIASGKSLDTSPAEIRLADSFSQESSASKKPNLPSNPTSNRSPIAVFSNKSAFSSQFTSGNETNRSLPIIKEDEREHGLNFENESQVDRSSFYSDMHDKSCVSQVQMLPYLHRDKEETYTGKMQKTESKNPLVNYIYKVASQLKLNPQLILSDEKEEPMTKLHEANEANEEEAGGFAHHSSRVQFERTAVRANNPYEINEIRTQLAQFGKLERQMTINPKKFYSPVKMESSKMRLSMGKTHSNPVEQTPKGMLTARYASQKLETDEHQEVVDELPDLIRIKVQMSIVSLALRKNQETLKTLETQLKEHVNKQTDQINRHEKKVQTFMKNLQRQNKKLHFAFLFACPLVLSCGQVEQEKYKLIPKLEYEREYAKIKKRLEVSQCQITITKQQCTTESFSQVLSRQPLGIHFSGHGIINSYETVGDYHEVTKNQGDFLLFETDEGDSQLVSRTQLKKLIELNEAELDFVFVASCHSEFVGRIFLEAGAKHVICINQSNEVEDNAVLTFTDAFYDAVFSNSMSICKAFLNARAVVSINHSPEQANIFKLLLYDVHLADKVDRKLSLKKPSNLTVQDATQNAGGNSGPSRKSNDSSVGPFTKRQNSKGANSNKEKSQEKKVKHTCSKFGKFPKGLYKEINQNEPQIQIGPIDQPVFIARQKDMFKLIQKVLSAKSSRLLTLLGLPGIGKSSLVRKTIQHISERMLLPGGYIIINVRGIKDCEVFLRTFNQQVITEDNPMFYFTLGQALEQGRSMQQDSLTITDLILEKIASLEQKVLLVIDNAEDLITFDKTTHKNSFKQIVKYFLNQVPNLKILLTTRQRLKLQSDFNEEVILLYGLPALQSEILFAKLSRQLLPKEINELLKTTPDYTKYPSEKKFAPPKKLHDHHLFRMIGGNPSMIVILAPILADTERPMDLVGLYRTLCQNQLQNDHVGEDAMVSLMQSTVHISLQSIQNSDPECLELLCLLSLMPGGVSARDLDVLWKEIKEKTETDHAHGISMRQSFVSVLVEADESHQINQDCKWRRAFLKLRKHRLIQERSVNGEANRPSKPDANNWMEDSNLSLPACVLNVAEAQITTQMYQRYTAVLSDYFLKEFSKIYERNQNSVVTSNQKQMNQQVSSKINKLEGNFWAFIARKVDMQLDLSSRGTSEKSDNEELKENDGDSSDGEVLLHMDSPKKHGETSSVFESDDSEDVLGEQIEVQIKVKNDKKKRLQEIAKQDYIVDESDVSMAHLTPKARATLRWQTAFQIVKMKIQRSKLNNVKLAFGEIEEASNSDSEDAKSKSSVNDSRNQWLINLQQTGSQKNLFKPMGSQRNLLQPVSCRKEATGGVSESKALKVEAIEEKTKALYRKHTLNLVNRMKYQKSMLGLRQASTISRAFSIELELLCTMKDDELAIVYYIANLVLLEQYSLADSQIEKQLLKLKLSTGTFNGNIRRLQAICKLQMLKLRFSRIKYNPNIQEAQIEFAEKVNRVKHCLQKALSYYTMVAKNHWGIGLTNFLYAELLYFVEQATREIQERARKAFVKSESVSNVQTQPSSTVSRLRTITKKTFNSDFNLKEQAWQEGDHIKRAIKKLQDAKEAFEKINHHRGLALTAKLLADVKLLTSSQDEKSFSDSPAKIDPDTIQLDAMYQKHMRDFREQQRNLQPGDMRHELCITRLQGEQVSLSVEIVRGVPERKGLFERQKTQIHDTVELKASISESVREQPSLREEKPLEGLHTELRDRLYSVINTQVKKNKQQIHQSPYFSPPSSNRRLTVAPLNHSSYGDLQNQSVQVQCLDSTSEDEEGVDTRINKLSFQQPNVSPAGKAPVPNSFLSTERVIAFPGVNMPVEMHQPEDSEYSPTLNTAPLQKSMSERKIFNASKTMMFKK